MPGPPRRDIHPNKMVTYCTIEVNTNMLILTLIKDGNALQKLIFGSNSKPSAFLTNFMNRMPAIKYKDSTTINLQQ